MRYFKAQTSRSIFGLALLICWSLLIPASLLAATDGNQPLIDKLKEQKASLRGQELEVSTLLQALGRQAKVNIFVSNNIKDNIDIEVEDLSLYDIFTLVLDAKKLHSTEKNNTIFIEKLADFQSAQKDINTERICTDFGNTADYLEQLKLMLSSGGSVSSANRGNCLIVKDRQENINKLKEMLADLDTPVPQVHIEARIVTVSKEAKKRLGIKWGYSNNLTSNPISGSADLSITGSTEMAIGFVRNNLDLSIDLQAMQQDDMLNILSAPKVLVLDGQQAEIKQGKEVPYVTQSGDLINTSFREANLSLKVTPRIIKNKFIELEVAVTNDSVDQTSASTEPLINKQAITTKLFLQNNSTVVIGGILLQSDDNQKGSVPFISKIPILGLLFRNKERRKENSELVVFITPTIVDMQSALLNGSARDDNLNDNFNQTAEDAER